MVDESDRVVEEGDGNEEVEEDGNGLAEVADSLAGEPWMVET